MTSALGMRVKLDRLRRAHNIELRKVFIPPVPPTSRAQWLEGYVATLDVDLVRNRFRPFAFGNVARQNFPPLYYRHNAAAGVVGEITSLEYDPKGALRVTARVTDPIARLCNSWSVGCTVRSYSIQNQDDPDGFHALIQQAELTEISLTPEPANPAAIVTSRRDVSSQAEFYGAAADAFTRISAMVALIQKGVSNEQFHR